MFSFHKPRVYRSAEGCCICRAKSSSSRFTDSRKYEQDSMKCFDLKYPRHGEICNACVLLVKRFKRLPVGSNRHWGHVVDARAGPGTKSISKHKKNRDDTENTSQNPSSNNTNNSRRTQSSKSLISEKFTKIFKKTKKSKVVAELTDDHKNDVLRKSTAGSQAWSDRQFPIHDSMDSDYEDIADGSTVGGGGTEVVRRGNTNNNTIVQFQTQTRASRKSATMGVAGGDSGVANNLYAMRRKHPLKTGTKRRKCMPPIRNRTTLKLFNDNAQFYDELEWQERKSCCGKIYISSALANTILLDMDNFKVCAEHQRSSKQQQQQKQPIATQPQQKTIIATLPAVVQISAPTASLATATHLPPTPAVAAAAASTNSNPTPVLKKHHLFFKRQSECFPQLDLCANNNSNNNSINNISNKTDSSGAATNTPVIIKSNNNANNRSTTATTTQHQTSLSTLSGINSTITNNMSATLPLAINTTTSISAISSSISPSNNTAHHSMQLPRNSSAKVTTTISPPLPTTTTTATNLSSNNRLLHKIRTGKIMKQSLDKIGVMPTIHGAMSPTAIERIKTGDLPEVKPIMRGVPKSYVITKPTANGVGAINNTQYPTTTTQYYAPGSSPTSTCSNSSVISTASSASAAPKFSDNSSDSGFDENLQDRKSASPLEDTEKKLAARATAGNVHTMFLASGVQIQGQHQNLMLTGNEMAAKLLHNRKQQMSMLAAAAAGAGSSGGMHQHYQQQQTPNNLTRIGTSSQSLKISQVTPTTISTVPVGGNSSSSSSNLGSHSKATTTSASITQSTRAIYNNNTIQHENGVTTIVPASSLAASSQTAAMNAHAPSTVTITPAPSHHMANAGASTAISLTKKLTTTGLGVNLITTGSNNQSNILHTVANSATHLMNHNNNIALIQQHHNQQQQQQQAQHQHLQHHHHQHHHNATTNLNQKIILLKTTGPTKYNSTLGNMSVTNNANNIKMTSASAASTVKN